MTATSRADVPGGASAGDRPEELLDFRHVTPAFRTFCGPNALTALAAEQDRLGCERTVLFYGRSMRRHSAVLERIAAALGSRVAGRFEDVKEHTPVPVVEQAARELERLNADAVVAVGGGSAIVTARAATILLAETKNVRELCTQPGADGRLVSPRLLAPKLPIWLVPSTPTTAYGKAGSAVRDPETNDRLALFDPKTRAQGVVLDPQVALTAPASLALGSALNAFSMTVESLQASVDPLADALLLHALRIIVEWLPQLEAAPEDAQPRLQLMIAALLTGQGSDYVGGGLAQALAHAAGPRSSVSNGIVEVILLPHTMRFTAPATPGRLKHVADVLARSHGADAIDDAAIAGVDALLTGLGVPRRLRDVGIGRHLLPDITDHAMGDWSLSRIPRRVERRDLNDLLEAAW